MTYHAYHLHLSQEMVQGVRVALIPGAPERCSEIADFFGESHQIAYNREYRSVISESREGKILVVSSGIGGPSLAIAIEELVRLGIRYFLRVGTCGAIAADLNPVDLVVSEGAVRLDGTSGHYAPLPYPACADTEVTTLIVRACRELGFPYRAGITCSSATFYPGQERYDTFTGYVIRELQGSLDEWRRLGVLNYEMETATLFTMARVFGMRAGAVCAVLVNRLTSEEPDHATYKEAESRVSRAAVQTAKLILKELIW